MSNKVLLLSHSTGIDGPIDYFEKYLLEQHDDVSKLSFPLLNFSAESALYRNGKKVRTFTSTQKANLIDLPHHFLKSLMYILNERPQVVFAANPFLTTAALTSKLFLPVRVVHFASDYSEQRFSVSFLNAIYTGLERIACTFADQVVSNTQRAQSARLRLGLESERSLVKINPYYGPKVSLASRNVDTRSFVYVGNVTNEHGLIDVIEALGKCMQSLTIIGQGEEIEKVSELSKKYGFTLKIFEKKSHDFVIQFLQDFSGFGLAPYNSKMDWTYYCSPLKVVEYVSCGVPVIMTDRPEIAVMIHKEKLGIVYSISESLCKKIKAYSEEYSLERFRSIRSRLHYKTVYKGIL